MARKRRPPPVPYRPFALNRRVQVGATEMHQASHSKVGLHNSICFGGSRLKTYRFRGPGADTNTAEDAIAISIAQTTVRSVLQGRFDFLVQGHQPVVQCRWNARGVVADLQQFIAQV